MTESEHYIERPLSNDDQYRAEQAWVLEMERMAEEVLADITSRRIENRILLDELRRIRADYQSLPVAWPSHQAGGEEVSASEGSHG